MTIKDRVNMVVKDILVIMDPKNVVQSSVKATMTVCGGQYFTTSFESKNDKLIKVSANSGHHIVRVSIDDREISLEVDPDQKEEILAAVKRLRDVMDDFTAKQISKLAKYMKKERPEMAK